MGQRWHGRSGTRGLAGIMVGILTATAVAVVTPGVAGADDPEPPDWVEDLEDQGTDSREPIPWEEADPAPLPGSTRTALLPAADLPEPSAWDVTLRGAGQAATVDRGSSGPVRVAAGADGFAGDRLRIEVLDQAMAERAGASGFVFGVSERPARGDRSLSQADAPVPAQLTIDYSDFAHAYGADYADRLQVVALPDCVMEDPLPAGCAVAGVRLPSRNDSRAKRLVASVEDLAGLAADDTVATRDLGTVAEVDLDQVDAGTVELNEGDEPAPDDTDDPAAADADDGPAGDDVAATGDAGVLFAVTADVSSESGAFDATPLTGTGQWQVSAGSGEFAYSYDFDVPPPAGGTAPTVSLGYSSGSVDGLTNSSNTQAPPAGLGWSQFDNAFIERRYEPCATTIGSTDLCWLNQNAVLSLDGASGTLLPVNAEGTEWRVNSDAGWKVERLTGAANGDGGEDDLDGQGEHWKVTATDGTQYFFGVGQTTTGASTNSTATVPVFGDHDIDPCWGNLPGVPDDFGVCDQAWRWNLDRVVDPDGNVTTYHYSRASNRYAALNGLFDGMAYHSATMLNRIEYGIRSGQATMRVIFGRDYRCVDLDATCPIPTKSNASRFPDVPVDLICGSDDCTATSPSFFVKTRYAHVRTEVLIGQEWRAVTQYNLHHSLSKGTSGKKKLYLRGITQVGLADRSLPWGLPLPTTNFDYTWFDNRVDVDEAAGRKPLRHGRLTRVVNPYGGTVDVTYGQNRTCPANYRPFPWHGNVRDCFPQTMYDQGRRRTGVFHKYLVTHVTESAGFLTVPITTNYTYVGDPGWAFNYGSFAQYSHEWGWSGWRGYGETVVTQGDSKSRVRVFRGLEGDPLWVDRGGGHFCACGYRESQVRSFEGTPFTDFPALSGRTVEQANLGELDGVADSILQSTLYEYERQVVVDRPVGQLDAEWADVAVVTESVATAPGEFRRRGGTTSYDQAPQSPIPRATASLEAGWLDVTGDERCSLTSFADNPARWMFEYPASNRVVAGQCDSTQVLSESQTYYDGSTTLGAPPVRGNPTLERTRLDAGTWAETTTGFDSLGRPVGVTDPRGATTTTSYEANPAHALPTSTTVTNALGHSATTTWNRLHQAPQAERDANGNLTTYSYDGLGRLTAVRLPTEQPHETGKEPSWRFAYDIAPDKSTLPVVRSRQLTSPATSGSGVVFEDTWTVYDRLAREWQVQQQSPVSGRTIVALTGYDDRGNVQVSTAPQAVSGSPGALLWPSSWENTTRTSYDELGREERQEWLRGDQVARTTTTSYTADTVTVTGPDGSQVRETLDGLGRTVAVAEHDGTDWVSSRYGYDLADNLMSVIDPAGNRTTYTYNLVGWRLTQDDPDRGTASFGYDRAGNQTSVVDADGEAVHTAYDELGRQVERRAGSPSGQLLASWDYDASGQLGLLDRETRHAAEGDWVSDVTGYDGRNRVLGTTTVVPDGIPGLSGEYSFSQTYDRADRVTSVSYPAVGGLPAETVTTTYGNLGLPTRMSGLEPYVRTTTYDNRGRLTAAAFGPQNPEGGVWMARSWSFNADQQPAATEAYVAGSGLPGGIVGRHELTYDDAGNVTERATSLDGQAWRECYEHDARRRLVSAFTVASGETCAGGTRGTGDQPYDQRFVYSPDGNLVERGDTVAPDPEAVTQYRYPASGQDRPHAPTAVGSDSYTWGADGTLRQRTVDGQGETLTWDAEQRLASVESAEGTTSFVYAAGGQRMLRRTDDAATLYVPGHEISASADGSTVTAVRSYVFDGSLVATRSSGPSAGVRYMLADAAGSVELAVESGGQPTASRAYEPYGRVRAETGDLGTDQGFLGQVEDPSTDLSYLQNRYYDANTGVFLSADPVYDTGQVKSLNPYGYAAGNPTTFQDANGLSPTYIHGLEMQNFALKFQNKQLRGHIKRLGGHIQDLQSVIRKQRRAINKLLTHIETLESVIRQQQSIIRRLVDRVNHLVDVVNYQRVVIGQLYDRIAYQQRIINWQAGVIRWQAGVIRYQQAVIHYQQGVINYQAGVITYQRGVIGAQAAIIYTQAVDYNSLFEKAGAQSSYARSLEQQLAVSAVVMQAQSSMINRQSYRVESLRQQRNFYFHYAVSAHEGAQEEAGFLAIPSMLPYVGNIISGARDLKTLLQDPPPLPRELGGLRNEWTRGMFENDPPRCRLFDDCGP